MAARRFARREHAPAWRDTARHGLRFLHDTQRDPHRGGYAWLLRFDGGRREVIDATPPRRRRRRRGRIPRARATAGCGP
jgi:mannose/cellobiose epimerase-like protein (N-acyl-D-glucosamine 2-epimerase family)